MKKILVALSATALMSIAPFALAASTTDLIVTGSITPNACIPSLSGNGLVDYGKILAKDLNQDTSTPLEPRTVNLTVKCDAATRIALQGIDNRSGSSDLNSAFGLGKANGAQNIGSYLLGMGNAIADGVNVQTIQSEDGVTGWSGKIFWTPGHFTSVSDPADTSQPIHFQDLALDLVVGAFIVAANQLDLTNQITIDGSAALEMKYL